MEINSANVLGQIASVPVPTTPRQAAEKRDLIQAVRALNAAEHLNDNELVFYIDRVTKLPVIQIVNKETKEVVGQVPKETLLLLAERFR